MRLLFSVDTDWIRRTYRLHYHYLAKHLSTRKHRIFVVDFNAHWSSEANNLPLSGYFDKTTNANIYRPKHLYIEKFDRFTASITVLFLFIKLAIKEKIDIIVNGSIVYAVPVIIMSKIFG